MARGNNTILTDLGIERMKAAAAGKRVEVFDTLEPGLYVRVNDRRAKSFYLVSRPAGASARIKVCLGHFPGIGIAEARTLAAQQKRHLRAGLDPRTVAEKERAERRAAEAKARRGRVEILFAAFVVKHCKRNAPGSWRQIKSRLRRLVLPKWKGRTADSITPADVAELLDRIKLPRQANLVFSTVRKFFNWCLATGAGGVTRNPCGGMAPPREENARERVLADSELAEILAAAGTLDATRHDFVRSLVLTGQRRSEVAGMRWSEIDLDAAEWRIPGERMKAGQPHVVPLSDAMVDLLRSRDHGKGAVYVFSTDGGATHLQDFSTMKEKLDKALIEARQENDPEAMAPERWTFHDFRRTVATGMQRLRVDREVIKRVLHHSAPKARVVTDVYARFDFMEERRAALEAWARRVDALVNPPADNVVALAGARA